MSAFSFDAQNGVTIHPMSMDSNSLNIAHFGDQNWSSGDYRDTSFDYSYASSNSSISCGSLTSGSLTPQSSMSASTSRRQSLVCSAAKPASSFDTQGQIKGFRTPRTPSKLDDQYSAMQGLTSSAYSFTASNASPSSQELENMFIMDTEEPTVSNKLQTALAFGPCSDSQASSFSSYENINVKLQNFGQDTKSWDPNYSTNQLPSGLDIDRPFAYQGIPIESNYSDRHNGLPTPQTVMPSQTTYQLPQSAYVVPQTPPRVLRDAFVSPSKRSFENSPMDELDSILEPSEDLALYGSASDTGQDPILQSLGLQHRVKKSEYSDDESTLFSQSTNESPVSDTPSLFARKRQYRKGQPGSRSGESSRKRGQKHLPYAIKKEAVSKHACHKCKQRPGEAKIQFKRPEHLNRHLHSVHGDEKDKVKCRIEGCPASILNRPDNLNAHYKNTHMYGPCEVKGKKRKWLSIEEAKQLGLGDLDPRTKLGSAKSRSKSK